MFLWVWMFKALYGHTLPFFSGSLLGLSCSVCQLFKVRSASRSLACGKERDPEVEKCARELSKQVADGGQKTRSRPANIGDLVSYNSVFLCSRLRSKRGCPWAVAYFSHWCMVLLSSYLTKCLLSCDGFWTWGFESPFCFSLVIFCNLSEGSDFLIFNSYTWDLELTVFSFSFLTEPHSVGWLATLTMHFYAAWPQRWDTNLLFSLPSAVITEGLLWGCFTT